MASPLHLPRAMHISTLSTALLILTFTAGLFVTSSVSADASDKPVVAYGSSNWALPYKTQELFYRGYQLGFSNTIKNKNRVELYSHHDKTKKALGPVTAIKNILQKKPVAVAGFPSSHASLQVAPITAKEGVLTLSVSAGHSKLASMGPTFFSGAEPMSSHTKALVGFINNKFKKKKGLAIYLNKSVFSVNILSNTKKAAKAQFDNGQITKTALTKDLKLKPAILKKMVDGEVDYLVITMYPDESLPLLEQMQKLGIDIPLVTNSSWNTADIDLIRRTLTSKNSPIYIVSTNNTQSKSYKRFARIAKSRFGVKPSIEMAYGFDAGVVLAQTINRIKGKVTKESMLKAFQENGACFTGTTSGDLCFKKSGGHSIKHAQVMVLTRNGLRPVSKVEKP